ncbi:MAG: CheR family methyltransferase [Desulfobacterales bacterium]
MSTEKRKPAAKQSTTTKKVRGKTREKKVPSVKTRLASGTRPERDTGPAGSSPVKASFPIVGIGASAGGLEALEAFFENLPEESGMAFVVITHTDPNHTSLLPDILKRKTKKAVEVKLIEDAMPVEPNCVFLPPSDRDPFIGDETFHLRERPVREEMHMPVDLFFKSLSEARGERAGCVILSGTGSDGTYGLRAIKEKSGIVVVQEPASARHTGMPASAIDTGLADFVITPAEMAGRLIEYFKHPVEITPAPDNKNKKETDPLKRILALLANRTRHDFNLYKDGTLTRRIARRIAVTRSRNASEYLQTLYRDDGEVRALFQDLLIGVTSFFRDPEAFAHLQERALPEMFSKKKAGETLRAWMPGCSSGEETYSVAIILKEYMEENGVIKGMQIFGTDIDPLAIEKARTATYIRNIAADVDAERLKRFFDKVGDRYRVRREIRESVVFAEQNLLRDPPFSDLDLLVCRNLLIYLKPEAQERLVPLFHYTLKKHGILFLGNSESIGRFPELFEPLSRQYSIFRKRETAIHPQVRFPAGKTAPTVQDIEKADEGEGPAGAHISQEKAVEDLLLKEFAPACVIVNKSGEILYTRGRTGKYLELAPGRPFLNVADMAREGLRFSLMSALRRAGDEKGPAYHKGLQVKTNGEHQWVDLTVLRFNRPPFGEAFIVALEEREAPVKRIEAPEPGKTEALEEDRLGELTRELTRTQQEYRGAMEELETSNEELRSTNEEMQSANEELQSTNEELESSREELQSLNEELNTVNSELQVKIRELDDSYQAVTDALDSTLIAMVFLDENLRVVRFTKAVNRLINLIDSDVGRPLEHISDNLDVEDLSEKAAGVLKSLIPFESEVTTDDGHWYHMNIMVHRREEHLIEGVVLTFANIDAQKRAQQEIEAMKSREAQSAKRFAESIVETVGEALLVLDEQMRVVTANRRFFDHFDTNREETEGKSLFELGNGQWNIPELRRLLQETAGHQKAFEDYPIEHRFPKIGLKKMLLNGRHLREEDPSQNKILLVIEDVTDRQ